MSMAYDDHYDAANEAVCHICHGAGVIDCEGCDEPHSLAFSYHTCGWCDGTGRAEEMT